MASPPALPRREGAGVRKALITDFKLLINIFKKK